MEKKLINTEVTREQIEEAISNLQSLLDSHNTTAKLFNMSEQEIPNAPATWLGLIALGIGQLKKNGLPQEDLEETLHRLAHDVIYREVH